MTETTVKHTYVVFREMQPLRKRIIFLWQIVLSPILALAAVFIYFIFWHVILHKSPGDEPAMATISVILSLGIVANIGLMILFYHKAKLETEVRGDGLYIRFFPFVLFFHKIPLDKVQRCEVITRECSGESRNWGAYMTRTRKAFYVRGNRGVQIDISGGKHLFIGSQRPEELAHALATLLPQGKSG